MITKKQARCLVCKQESEYYVDYDFDLHIVVEEYFDCPNCGYFYHMAYSEPFEGIRIPKGSTEAEVRDKYLKQILAHGLNLYKEEELF